MFVVTLNHEFTSPRKFQQSNELSNLHFNAINQLPSKSRPHELTKLWQSTNIGSCEQEWFLVLYYCYDTLVMTSMSICQISNWRHADITDMTSSGVKGYEIQKIPLKTTWRQYCVRTFRKILIFSHPVKLYVHIKDTYITISRNYCLDKLKVHLIYVFFCDLMSLVTQNYWQHFTLKDFKEKSKYYSKWHENFYR